MIPALAAALIVLAGPAAPAGPPPRPEPLRQEDREARSPPDGPRLSDEDQAVVEHLELLQRLELLRDLPMFDDGGEPSEAGGEASGPGKKPPR